MGGVRYLFRRFYINIHYQSQPYRATQLQMLKQFKASLLQLTENGRLNPITRKFYACVSWRLP
jgi:hypothetical protein